MATSSPNNLKNLPNDVLLQIFDKISSTDFIKLGSTCKQLHAIYLEAKKHSKEREFPILWSSHAKTLFSFFQNKHYSSRMVKNPNRFCRLRGSCFGWRGVCNEDFSITLLDPFSHNTINLPKIWRCIFESVGPHINDSCVEVHMIVGFYLCSIKSGQKSWRVQKIGRPRYPDSDYFPLRDLIFYKGRLHIMDEKGKLWVKRKYNKRGFKLIDVFRKINNPYLFNSFKYLVESTKGELLLISRTRYCEYTGYCFVVYKLKKGRIWEEIDRLNDDEAVCLGDDGGVCVPASRFPLIQANCLYYALDFISIETRTDVGVYHMSDKRYEKNEAIGDKVLCHGTMIYPTLH